MFIDLITALEDNYESMKIISDQGVNLNKFPNLSNELMQVIAVSLIQMTDKPVMQKDIDFIVADIKRYIKGDQIRMCKKRKEKISLNRTEDYFEHLLSLLNQ